MPAGRAGRELGRGRELAPRTVQAAGTQAPRVSPGREAATWAQRGVSTELPLGKESSGKGERRGQSIHPATEGFPDGRPGGRRPSSPPSGSCWALAAGGPRDEPAHWRCSRPPGSGQPRPGRGRWLVDVGDGSGLGVKKPSLPKAWLEGMDPVEVEGSQRGRARKGCASASTVPRGNLTPICPR